MWFSTEESTNGGAGGELLTEKKAGIRITLLVISCHTLRIKSNTLCSVNI